MHTRVHRFICLVVTVIAMLVASFPSTAVRAAYRPVSSVVLTVGSPTMTVNGFSFPIGPAVAGVARGGTDGRERQCARRRAHGVDRHRPPSRADYRPWSRDDPCPVCRTVARGARNMDCPEQDDYTYPAQTDGAGH